MIKELISRAITGIGIGSTAFLFLISGADGIQITHEQVLIVVALSGFLGASSIIFAWDWINYYLTIVIYFVLTVLVTYGMVLTFNWKLDYKFWLVFIVVYGLIWIFIWIKQWANVKRANRMIASMNKKSIHK